MMSLMILILVRLMSNLLRKRSLKRKSPLIQLILNIFRIVLLLLLLRKSLLPSFSHKLKKKDKAYIEKMRETFSQLQINISLLDVIQQMPPCARFSKDLCTTKRATSVPKKTFLDSSASSTLFHQILVKYKGRRCPTISIVIGD